VFGEGVIRNPRTGEAQYPAPGLPGVGGFFGVPSTVFDVGQFQQRQEEERIAAVIRYLRQIGAIPPAEDPNAPAPSASLFGG
jgi:hypothetical protein